MKLWNIEEQTKGKHLILQAYLDEWLPKLGTWNSRILFIDGFCGPGRYLGAELGSPLIALTKMKEHPILEKCEEVVFAFCDEKPETLDHLKSEVESLGVLPSNFTVMFWKSDFATQMNKLLDHLQVKNASWGGPEIVDT